MHHSKNEFVRGSSYINGIESFWGYAKTKLVKFKGMDKKMFNLHLKECEWRFNIGAPSKLLLDLKSLLKESY